MLFKPHDYQKKALIGIDNNPDNLLHSILMFPRQAGKTTLVSAYLLHYALFNDFKTIAIVANKADTAIEIMSRIRYAYENLPLWMQCGVKEFNKGSIELENGSKIISSCTSSTAISGKSVSILYIDEMSKIPKNIANDFVSSTFPVIASGKTTKIIITSTPAGLNLFFDFWKGAINKKNDFYPMKINWWDVPGRDEEWKQKEIRKFGKQKFSQEYSCQFLGSSSTLVDPDTIERIDTIEPIETKMNGFLNVYEMPLKNGLYFLGVDSSKGTGLDFSVIQVLKFISDKDVEQVAVYRNDKINTHDFGEVVIAVSEFYNNAMIMIENNDVGESVCNTIWHEYEYDYLCNVDTKGLGIRATKQSKLNACINLKRYLEEKWLKIHDKDTLYELARFVEVRPNIFQAESECHDDTITSLYWALFVVKTVFYEGKISNKININSNRNELQDSEELIGENVEPPAIVFDEGDGFDDYGFDF